MANPTKGSVRTRLPKRVERLQMVSTSNALERRGPGRRVYPNAIPGQVLERRHPGLASRAECDAPPS
jgi:hypothetical protein